MEKQGKASIAKGRSQCLQGKTTSILELLGAQDGSLEQRHHLDPQDPPKTFSTSSLASLVRNQHLQGPGAGGMIQLETEC